jgi:hypothetical protein
MESKIRILGTFLVLQLILAMVVLVGGEKYAAFEASEPLLTFDADQVDRIEISEPDKEPLILEKKGEEWRLPELDDFSAKANSVDNLIGKLTAMKRGWPVAETDSAAERFKVEEDGYERKVVLYEEGDEVAELYLGTSPGFRKIHARVADENPIYAVEFNNYEASRESRDWINGEILQLEADKISRIEMPDVTLVRDGDKMTVEGLEEDETQQDEEVKKLVDRIAKLDLQNVFGSEAEEAWNLDDPLLTFSVTLDGGKKRDYRVAKPKSGSDYVLKVSDHDHYFQVASWNIDPIEQANRARLVESPEVDEPQQKDEAPAQPQASDLTAPIPGASDALLEEVIRDTSD